MEILLKSAVLRRVAITKTGDLDIALRFTGNPDAGYTQGDKLMLETLWKDDINLDVTIQESSDGM